MRKGVSLRGCFYIVVEHEAERDDAEGRLERERERREAYLVIDVEIGHFFQVAKLFSSYGHGLFNSCRLGVARI